MIRGTWGELIPSEPGSDRDRWLRARGWSSYEEYQLRGEEEANMKVQVTVSNLSPEQWREVNELPVTVDIPDGVVRACVVFEGGSAEERHLELPIKVLSTILTGLGRLNPTSHFVLNGECKCGFHAPELGPHPMCPVHVHSATCDHGSPLVSEVPSVFADAEPVRTYSDGCQSYGPYRPIKTVDRSDEIKG